MQSPLSIAGNPRAAFGSRRFHMRLLFRVLAWVLAATAAAAGVTTALTYFLAARSIPQASASWTVAGIEAPVEILRDAHFVPHIFADSDADAMFALGWAHAQDRLWQMELARRAARGRLAELLGPEALPIDRTMRALDLGSYAAESFERLAPGTQAVLTAYADGVNARIRGVNDQALGRGAPELFLFGGGALAPWTPTDSLSILKLMALRLTDAAQREARRARLLAHLPAEDVADLLPDYPDGGVTALPRFADAGPFAPPPPMRDAAGASPFAGVVPPHAAAPPEPRERHPLSPFADAGFGGASNAWAVDASRAAAGAPLLATDPHLWLSAPGVWHLARITSPGLDVIGATLPGLPAVAIGRNRDFGWGLTTAMVDDQDLYIERLNPDDPGQYLAPDGWTAFQTRTERIAVAGRPAETITLRWSRHGPVIPLNGDLDFSAVTPPGHVVALAWTALTAEDRSIEAVLGLMRASTIEEGAEALRAHVAPAQNVIMADAEGVGMVVAGAVPLRRQDSRSRGRTPSVGWLVENDWIGVMAADETPRAIRPGSGAVANANNRTTSAPFPRHLSHEWEAPYRIRRIEARLNDRPFHTRDSFMEMQNDPVSDMARGVLPLIARELWWGDPRADGDAGGPQAQRREAALALLADWNGAMTQHDPEPLIFSAWMRALTRRLAEDELGPLFPLIAGQRPLFVERVFRDIDGAGRWCDVVKTDQRETCAEMARRALDDALGELTATYGDGPSGWRWGQAHRAIHAHAPLGLVGPLRPFVNIEHESGGGDFAIMAAGTPGRGPQPDLNVLTAGFRAVYDFADLDRSMFIIATGQSGHPLSRHYEDLNALWRRGDYIPMSLNPEDARAGARGSTRLAPAG